MPMNHQTTGTLDERSAPSRPTIANRVLVSTVGQGANEEVDGVRKEKERLTINFQENYPWNPSASS